MHVSALHVDVPPLVHAVWGRIYVGKLSTLTAGLRARRPACVHPCEDAEDIANGRPHPGPGHGTRAHLRAIEERLRKAA
jgi:hypothetical protein